jgi:hypothetical protein
MEQGASAGAARGLGYAGLSARRTVWANEPAAAGCVRYSREYRRRVRQEQHARFIRFLHIASGSAGELEYHLLLAHELKLIEMPAYSSLLNEVTEVKRMLSSFTHKLTADN